MEKRIYDEKFYQDELAKDIFIQLEKNNLYSDVLAYYNYPLLTGGLDEEKISPTVCILSKKYGLINIIASSIINNDEESMVINLADRIDQIFYSRFIQNDSPLLKKGRDLSFNFRTIVFFNNITSKQRKIGNIDIINDISELSQIIEEQEMSDELYKTILAEIENSNATIKHEKREVKKKNTKADILNKIEQEIATLDSRQSQAAYTDITGPQRIRGLAGSGKTILLCMKAAYLHYKYPEKKILYTFYTKSLYDYIELLITRFYKKIGNGMPPDFKEGIHIRHSWGGATQSGVYTDTCWNNKIQPINFNDISATNKFDFACNDLLKRLNGNINKEYDYVIIDEAQDFSKSFFWLCREIVKNDSIIWAYDVCQNIFDVNIRDTVSLFENKYRKGGIDLVKLNQKTPDISNDIILEKCYRNPYEILVMAHALGFGIYNDELIQCFEDKLSWEEMGYVVEEGDCIEGEKMVISRPIENSPRNHRVADNFKLESLDDFEKEVNFVCNSIENDIKNEGLKPEDIMVISLDDRYAKTYFKKISVRLAEMNILSNNLSTDYFYRGFIKENCVTLSTVYKAKGNESAAVYVVGADAFENDKYDRSMRNKIFTAFTRAKVWLTVSGILIKDKNLEQEIEKVKANNYKFIFDYKPRNKIESELKYKQNAKIKAEITKQLNNENLKKFRPEDLEKIREMLIELDGDTNENKRK
jgi:superfamily I DNA and RNA helicase